MPSTTESTRVLAGRDIEIRGQVKANRIPGYSKTPAPKFESPGDCFSLGCGLRWECGVFGGPVGVEGVEEEEEAFGSEAEG